MSRTIPSAAVALTLFVTTGCGTRLPDHAFGPMGSEGGGAPVLADEGGGATPEGTVGARDRSMALETFDGDDATAPTGTGPSPSGRTGAPGETGSEPTGTDPGSPPTGSDAGSARNGASDVGITADTIRLGNISTIGGPLGPKVFSPSLHGAQAYIARINARGGVNGRRIELLTCDDRGDPDRNRQCARHLIEEEGIFAFVSNATRSYSAAGYVSEHGVPDVGSQPVGYEYFTYPWLFTVRGSRYPRDGEVGWKGQLYNGTALYRELKGALDLEAAAVFYYNVPISKAYGSFIVRALETEGYEVHAYEINPALPSFDSHVADMRSRGVDAVFDAMDLTGNQNLCRSMERQDFAVSAKVGAVVSWSRRVDDQFPEICKRSYYVSGESVPYSSDLPAIRDFRATMAAVHGDAVLEELHQWHLEGFIGAKMLVEGIERMGADVTRAGLRRWIESFSHDAGYTADGMMLSQSWQPLDFDTAETSTDCLTLARWDLEQRDFVNYGDGPVCHEVPLIAWDPAAN